MYGLKNSCRHELGPEVDRKKRMHVQVLLSPTALARRQPTERQLTEQRPTERQLTTQLPTRRRLAKQGPTERQLTTQMPPLTAPLRNVRGEMLELCCATCRRC